jgi:DNA-binding MarR family transcriptional regulator
VALDGIRRLDRGLRLAARDVERSTGLSAAQLFVMSNLASAPAASLSELATRTMTDRSSVSVVVDRLVAAKLVERVTSEGDRRRAEVRLTRVGRRRLERAPAPPTDRLLRAIARWESADVRRLGALLRRLNAQLGFAESGLLFEADG